MEPTAPQPSRPADALQHLGTLYRLARLLTPTAGAAERLVERTYGRAAGAEDDRAALLALLLEEHHAQAEAESQPPLAPLHLRAAEDLARHRLPAAFAALPPDEQTLLLLTDVEGLAPGEAARALGLAPEAADDLVQGARSSLASRLYRQADPALQPLLHGYLSADGADERLRVLVREALAPAPQAIPSSLAARLRERDGTRADVPAPPTPAPAPPEPQPSRSKLRSASTILATIALVVLIGLLGMQYLLDEAPDDPAPRDLVTLAAARADAVQPAYPTSDADSAAAFVQRALGLQVQPPQIAGAQLEGASVAHLADGVEVPVYIYRDDRSGEAFPVFALSYRLLDRYRDRLALGVGVRDRLASTDGYAREEAGGRGVLLWRERDDVFAAVPAGPPTALEPRIAR